MASPHENSSRFTSHSKNGHVRRRTFGATPSKSIRTPPAWRPASGEMSLSTIFLSLHGHGSRADTQPRARPLRQVSAPRQHPQSDHRVRRGRDADPFRGHVGARLRTEQAGARKKITQDLVSQSEQTARSM